MITDVQRPGDAVICGKLDFRMRWGRVTSIVRGAVGYSGKALGLRHKGPGFESRL